MTNSDTTKEQATLEYRKYKAQNLSEVEKSYLETIKSAEKKLRGDFCDKMIWL